MTKQDLPKSAETLPIRFPRILSCPNTATPLFFLRRREYAEEYSSFFNLFKVPPSRHTHQHYRFPRIRSCQSTATPLFPFTASLFNLFKVPPDTHTPTLQVKRNRILKAKLKTKICNGHIQTEFFNNIR